MCWAGFGTARKSRPCCATPRSSTPSAAGFSRPTVSIPPSRQHPMMNDPDKGTHLRERALEDTLSRANDFLEQTIKACDQAKLMKAKQGVIGLSIFLLCAVLGFILGLSLAINLTFWITR